MYIDNQQGYWRPKRLYQTFSTWHLENISPNIFFQMDTIRKNILGHKTNIDILKIIGILQNMFSEQNAIKLEIKYKR